MRGCWVNGTNEHEEYEQRSLDSSRRLNFGLLQLPELIPRIRHAIARATERKPVSLSFLIAEWQASLCFSCYSETRYV